RTRHERAGVVQVTGRGEGAAPCQSERAAIVEERRESVRVRGREDLRAGPVEGEVCRVDVDRARQTKRRGDDERSTSRRARRGDGEGSLLDVDGPVVGER